MLKKKTTTIDDLAVMVQNGFSELHTEMDKRFDAVDERFDVVDERFEAVDERFDAVDHRMDGLEQRMTGLEKRMDIFSDHDRRLVKVEKILFSSPARP